MVNSLQSLGRRRRGFSLVEFCITLAVLAIVSSLTVPAVARTLARQRVVAAAQDLAADIAQARQEASSRGSPMHVETQTGADWCWAVTRHAGCGCGNTSSDSGNGNGAGTGIGPSTCRLKVIRPADYPGVTLSAASNLRLEADGIANQSIAATLQAGEERVQVEVGPMGRARLCAPQGAVSGLKRC
jgi:type IV fimbrial biogenesis protein FimT